MSTEHDRIEVAGSIQNRSRRVAQLHLGGYVGIVLGSEFASVVERLLRTLLDGRFDVICKSRAVADPRTVRFDQVRSKYILRVGMVRIPSVLERLLGCLRVVLGTRICAIIPRLRADCG